MAKRLSGVFLGLILLAGLPATAGQKDSAASLESESRAALSKLYSTVPAAKALGAKSRAILVFPKVTKAGRMVGGQYGEGVWLEGGKSAGPCRTNGVSYGLQAGDQGLGARPRATLVFPEVTKAGLMVGGQYGDGVLLKGGKNAGQYSTTGVSYGLQAGAQNYGYAMFFMNDAALQQLDKGEGFEVGVGPSVVVMDEGKAK